MFHYKNTLTLLFIEQYTNSEINFKQFIVKIPFVHWIQYYIYMSLTFYKVHVLITLQQWNQSESFHIPSRVCKSMETKNTFTQLCPSILRWWGGGVGGGLHIIFLWNHCVRILCCKYGALSYVLLWTRCWCTTTQTKTPRNVARAARFLGNKGGLEASNYITIIVGEIYVLSVELVLVYFFHFKLRRL